MTDVSRYYDILIDEGQDPVHDPEPLKAYMDKWDGRIFIDKMQLDESKSVLEIGVGTGRIAVKVAPCCRMFFGIDISFKTIEKAKKNIKVGLFKKPSLVCADFLEYDFCEKFDVIYSSLTFLHIQDKQKAFEKTDSLLNDDGIFVLSIDKNQDEYLDTGTTKIKVYPDNPDAVKKYAKNTSLTLVEEYEAEFAHIFIFRK